MIPGGIKEAIDAHVKTGRGTGSFVNAVLENNLREACAQADDVNKFLLFDIVYYIYNECPAGCWGSPEKVKAWKAIGGIDGASALKKMKEGK
jgi:hypothetical protein